MARCSLYSPVASTKLTQTKASSTAVPTGESSGSMRRRRRVTKFKNVTLRLNDIMSKAVTMRAKTQGEADASVIRAILANELREEIKEVKAENKPEDKKQ
jgi:hypothetical protein